MLSVTLSLLLSVAPSVAVPGLTGAGLEAGEVDLYGTLLASGLRERGLKVITAEDMAAMLGMDRQRALLGCATTCSAEFAAALGTDGILLGRVGRLGAGYTLSARVLSAKDAEVLAEATETATGPEGMTAAIDHLAWRLATQLDWKWAGRGLHPGPDPTAPKPVATSLRPAAWVTLGVAVAGLASGLALRLKAEGTWRSLGQANTSADIVSLRNAGNLEQTLGFSLIGLGGAAAVTALVLALVSPEPASAVSFGVTPLQGGMFASLGWSWR